MTYSCIDTDINTHVDTKQVVMVYSSNDRKQEKAGKYFTKPAISVHTTVEFVGSFLPSLKKTTSEQR